MSIPSATIRDVREAEAVIREHVSSAPLIRSYALEKELGLPASEDVESRQFWVMVDMAWSR